MITVLAGMRGIGVASSPPKATASNAISIELVLTIVSPLDSEQSLSTTTDALIDYLPVTVSYAQTLAATVGTGAVVDYALTIFTPAATDQSATVTNAVALAHIETAFSPAPTEQGLNLTNQLNIVYEI